MSKEAEKMASANQTKMATEQDGVRANDVNLAEVKSHQPRQEYHALCCGNSAKDLVLIPMCLLMLYGFTAGIFALCLRAVLRTADSAAALWMFFAAYALFMFGLVSVLAVKEYKKSMLKRHEQDTSPFQYV